MTEESTRFVSAVMAARLCLRCASIKADIVEHILVGVIQALQRHIFVVEIVDECESCGRRAVVYALG